MRKLKYTEETCQLEALKYETRKEFQIKSNGAYSFARRNNFLDEACSHMEIIREKRELKLCQEEALKYNTRREFNLKSSTAYKLAKKYNIVDKVCSHMKIYTHNIESVKEEALKYDSRNEFQIKSNGAYDFARRNNLLDKVCSHMKIINKKHTFKSCQQEALKYNTRTEFAKNSSGAYNFCNKNNFLDKVCSHMKINVWSNKITIEFVNTLYNELNILSSIELISIINSNSLSVRLKRDGLYNELISSQSNSKERINIINKIKDKYDNELEDDELSYNEDNNINNEEYFDNKIDNTELSITDLQKTINTNSQIVYNLSDFHMFDNENIIKTFDNETLDFLLKNRIKILWNSFLNKNLTIDEIKKEKGKDNFNYIKNEFLKEYNEINNLKLPSDYKFTHSPNLMQLLTSDRLIKNKFYGNWSGTGSGKTLSAILSGRIANIKNTLIICNNATVEGWEKSINSYFNNNNIITDINNLDIDNNKFNYIIINYEKFQQKNSVELVNQLLTLNIDYIILDEVQNVKQREDDNCSIRKRNINNLRLGLQHLNNELLTLVMTATPVINNLIEAKYLIELLTGVEHSELETQPTIENGIKIYETLTRYGLRYIPQYNILVNEEIIKINGEHLSDKIINIHRGDYIGFEKSLLKTKLISVKDKIKKGTLIYTHYVTELKDIIGDYVSKLGLTYGYYTGDNKDGLELFKNGEIDVLIGSSPIGTGIDGIQNVCNTLIPICLPWTNSEYEQLKGRLIRQGSLFDNVNIYIPQVFIEKNDEEEWNYDNNRLNIIKYKGTLADLAVDGIVPFGTLPTKEKLIQDAQKELSNWLKEIEITV